MSFSSHRYARLAFSAVVVSVFITARARAQNSEVRSKILVSSDWLASHINDPNLVLLHVGEKSEYDREHLPGARFIRLDDVADSDHEKPGALMLQMPSSEKLREKLAGLGISDDSRVIVYYGNDWVTPATRVIFTLDYAGLGNQSSLLDGGMQQWKREKRAVTAALPPVTKGSIESRQARDLGRGWKIGIVLRWGADRNGNARRETSRRSHCRGEEYSLHGDQRRQAADQILSSARCTVCKSRSEAR
jgi:rhodanese-related sulfurtransferase